MEAVGKVTTFLLLSTTALLYGGWVLSILWAWFVVPALHVSTLSLVHAIGLNIIVSRWTMSPPDTKKPAPKWNELVASFLYPFANSTFALLVGWVVHLWA